MVRYDAATGDCFLIFLPFQPCSLASCPQHTTSIGSGALGLFAMLHCVHGVNHRAHQCSASLPKETEAPAARTAPARDTSSHTCRVFYDRLYPALQQPSSVNGLLAETAHAQTLDKPFRRKLQHQSRKIRRLRLQSSP